MKKRLFKVTAILTIIIALISGLIGSIKAENTFAKENTGSEGVTVAIKDEYDKKKWQYNYYFEYTIPEDYDGSTIKIDLIGDLIKHYEAGTYVPGDGENFYVNIINLSKNEYVYSNGSMKITDGNYVEEKDADMAYTYDNTDAEYVKGAYTALSNRPIAAKSTVWRTSNSALKDLLGITGNSAKDYTNELIANALIEAGYKNGLDDLDDYYVDYMNKKYDKTCTRLDEFSVKEICGSIFNGYIVGVREANKNIASLGYNMFYNNLLMLTLDDGTVTNEDCLAGRLSLGSWMRNENNVDSYMNEKTGTLEAGMKETRNILNAHLHINGPYTTNPYQETTWGMEFTFSLNKVEPPTEPPTEQEPTTEKPTEQESTTENPTKQEPTTERLTEQESTTQQPTTISATSSVAESSATQRVGEVAADEESVKTGDSRKAVMYISIIVAAGLVSAIVIIVNKKREIYKK
ncbi:MAG: hypothetical protein Q4E78_02380 [Eubacteriales bacterium]|nr:hypothetical protein [Eubacteriales bacterium]